MATEQVVERVAENLEEAAKVTRQLNTPAIGFGLVGLAVGAAVGFYFGRRWNREKIRAEAFEKSEKEVEQIREFYRQEAQASVKIVEAKPSLDDVVEEKGYTGPPAEQYADIPQPVRPTRPPVPVQEPFTSPLSAPLPKRDFTPGGIAKRHVAREKDKNEGWDFSAEVRERTNERPYIIHQDEFSQKEEGYGQVTLTYYAVDAVLTDEDEQPIDDQDEVVGLDNLSNFGHGADDYHVVYVRNDRLQLDYEVCLVAASYEETVQGRSNDATD
jgi:hypothetical protein